MSTVLTATTNLKKLTLIALSLNLLAMSWGASFDTAFASQPCPQESFQVEYYNNADLSGRSESGCEEKAADTLWALNHQWRRSGPSELGEDCVDNCGPPKRLAVVHPPRPPGGRVLGPSAKDNFSARWRGLFYFEEGVYKFTARADDGVRVWVNDDLIIDEWRTQPAKDHSKVKAMDQGLHSVKVEYYERTRNAILQFGWLPCPECPEDISEELQLADKATRTGIGVIKKPVEMAQRNCPPGTFVAEYYNNITFSNNGIGACEEPGGTMAIDHQWGLGGPSQLSSDCAKSCDHFSARWIGEFHFDQGDYDFITTSDDGVRVWVDGDLIIDEWSKHSVWTNHHRKRMTQGLHTLKVEYYERTEKAVLQFRWLPWPRTAH